MAKQSTGAARMIEKERTTNSDRMQEEQRLNAEMQSTVISD